VRLFVSLLAVGCIVSLAQCQWIVTTIQLSDTTRLSTISVLDYQSSNQTVYIGGDRSLVAVDAVTHGKLGWIKLPGRFNLTCAIAGDSKLYCGSPLGDSVWVVSCATNTYVKTLRLDTRMRAMCYAAELSRVYIACPGDSLVEVIDCRTDRVVTRIKVPCGPSALCYNPVRNRIYVATPWSDEVAVIDCSADTVISNIWVRGVEPTAIGYDPATEYVYALNHTSGSLSVIDCAGDSLLRVVPAGAKPERLVVGPDGKVYCGGYYDSVVTVIKAAGTTTIPVGRHLSEMSCDPVNKKIYCAMTDSEVVVLDATSDTVVARVAAGRDLRFVCYDPVDTSTWAASADTGNVVIIDGGTDQLIGAVPFDITRPGMLCYSPGSNHLYCSAEFNTDTTIRLIVIDGDSNRLLKVLDAGHSVESMLWNPVNNRVYFSDPVLGKVSILDCASDSIIATVPAGPSPEALCCGADGKVYVATGGGLAVVDPGGDSIRGVVPTPYAPTSLCYDRTDNKIYAAMSGGQRVCVIDVGSDSVVATILVANDPSIGEVSWDPHHNKVYACASGNNDRCVVVIDCAADTVLRSIRSGGWPGTAYVDTVTDKVFVSANVYSHIIDAATDTIEATLDGGLGRAIDNGRPGGANLAYCLKGGLCVYSGIYLSRVIKVGTDPSALAWNPTHSWVYVANTGSSSISVVSDTMLGVEETSNARPRMSNVGATVVRGVLVLGAVDSRQNTGYRAELLDITGRKVLDLVSGPNDVGRLAPGVYFVRAVSREPSAASCRKVVVTK
jgi:YVTN family beta-propeller protein